MKGIGHKPIYLCTTGQPFFLPKVNECLGMSRVALLLSLIATGIYLQPSVTFLRSRGGTVRGTNEILIWVKYIVYIYMYTVYTLSDRVVFKSEQKKHERSQPKIHTSSQMMTGYTKK